MTESQKSWKLNLDFKSDLPTLARSVNRIYYNFDFMLDVIEFYESSDLLNSHLVLIDFYENDIYKKTINVYEQGIDDSNRFSF